MSSNFSTTSKINPEDSSTWADKLFLTFDIDWAHDEILEEMIDIVEMYESPATWFVTNATPLIGSLRNNLDFELGIHPNFNFLFEGDDSAGKNAEEVVDRILNIVPEAKSVRSHSLTQSSRLIDLFRRKGLTHECNTFIPALSAIALKPWVLSCDFTCVPHFWEDDVHVLYESNGISPKNPFELATAGDGLKVFDFHPIHVFLNTESLERYERTRHLHHNPKELIKLCYEDYGTRNRFMEMLELAKNSCKSQQSFELKSFAIPRCDCMNQVIK